MASAIVSEVVKFMEVLPLTLQEQVLSFVRGLDPFQLRGTPGKQLLQFAGVIPKDDLKLMGEAIKQGCAQVDLNEW